MKAHTLVYVTAPSKKQATSIAKKLLELRLAACVNILPKVESLYLWRSKIEKSTECAMLVKTQKKHFDKVAALIKKHHTYAVPAILEISPSKVEKSFGQWIINETR